MGSVIIQQETTKDPISLMGREAGVCWNADLNDKKKNHNRGLDCIRSNHGRVMEYPQVYIVLDGYSAKVIREMYTHIGGSPTRLQESTRYVDYENFKYVTPPSIENKLNAKLMYEKEMERISNIVAALESYGIPREDASMLLPIGMSTKVVVRTNLRNLIDMSRQRLCARAYHEFRVMFHDIISALSEYSSEWNELIVKENVFHAKCEEYGRCTEKNSCGRYAEDESNG